MFLLVATAWLCLFPLFTGKAVPAVEAAIDSDPSSTTTSSVETAPRRRSTSPCRFGTCDGGQKKGPGLVNTAPKDVRSDQSSSTTSSVETALRRQAASPWRFGTRDGGQKKGPCSVNTAPKDVRSGSGSGSGSNGARPAGKQEIKSCGGRVRSYIRDVTRRLRHGTTEKSPPPPPPPRGSNGARPAGKQEAKGRIGMWSYLAKNMKALSLKVGGGGSRASRGRRVEAEELIVAKPKGVQMKALPLKLCGGRSQARAEAEELDLEIQDVLMTRPDGTKLRFRKRWWADNYLGIVEVVAEEHEGLVAQGRWRREPRAGAAAWAAREAEELELEMQDKDIAAVSASAKMAPAQEHEADEDRDPHPPRLDNVADEDEEEESDREWVAEPDPGVLMTLVSRPDGTNDLRKLRFRQELFDGPRAAQRWWADNYDGIVELYSIVQSNGHHDAEEDHHLPRRWQRLGCDSASTSGSSNGSGSGGGGSGSGGGSASMQGSPIPGLVVAKPKGVQMKAGSQALAEAEELDLEIQDVLMTRPDGTRLMFRKRWWADNYDGIVELVG